MKFEELSIHEDLLEAISFMNFEKLSPIQEKAIPMALQGKDLLACAQTGTGKTASFVIPVLDDLIRNGNKGTTTLIIVPTRELAVQIDQEIQGFSYFTSTTSKSVYGGDKGKDWDEQKRAITEGTNIIVASYS
jgi:superfamily II DNA/RNA helicase